MKRELKDLLQSRFNALAVEAEFVPMKRELKDDQHRAMRSLIRRSRVRPYEEGTESPTP